MLKKGNRANTLHGILLIVLFSFAAFYIAGFPLVKKLSFSPADRRARAGHALCQQPAQQTARNVGARHQVLYQAGAALGHHPLRVPPDALRGGGCGHPGRRGRPGRRDGHDPGRRPAGTPAEDRPRHGADDLDGQCHLRRGGRAGCRAGREMRGVQNRHCRLHGRDFRHPLDVPLPPDVPHGDARRAHGHGRGPSIRAARCTRWPMWRGRATQWIRPIRWESLGRPPLPR